MVGHKEPVVTGTGKLKERVKVRPKGSIWMYVDIFFLCVQWFGGGPFYGTGVNIAGCAAEVTSVAVAGGRGFWERAFCVCACVCKGEVVKMQSSKVQNCEQVETFKIIFFFMRTFPSVCTAPASQHRRSDSHPFRTKL